MIEPSLQMLIAVVPVIATGIIGYFFNKIKQRDEAREAEEKRRAKSILEREQATNQALRALCRDRIIQGYRYYKRHDGISTADLETMTKLYNAYHGLGGNGGIEKLVLEFKNLPTSEEKHNAQNQHLEH